MKLKSSRGHKLLTEQASLVCFFILVCSISWKIPKCMELNNKNNSQILNSKSLKKTINDPINGIISSLTLTDKEFDVLRKNKKRGKIILQFYFFQKQEYPFLLAYTSKRRKQRIKNPDDPITIKPTGKTKTFPLPFVLCDQELSIVEINKKLNNLKITAPYTIELVPDSTAISKSGIVYIVFDMKVRYKNKKTDGFVEVSLDIITNPSPPKDAEI